MLIFADARLAAKATRWHGSVSSSSVPWERRVSTVDSGRSLSNFDFWSLSVADDGNLKVQSAGYRIHRILESEQTPI